MMALRTFGVYLVEIVAGPTRVNAAIISEERIFGGNVARSTSCIGSSTRSTNLVTSSLVSNNVLNCNSRIAGS
jgi:hypothetical protein